MKPPKYYTTYRVGTFLLTLWLGTEIYARYSHKKFMRMVRERNSLMRLDNTSIKELINLDIETLSGEKLSFEKLEGSYLCVYYGDFKGFLKVRSTLSTTPYAQELRYLYITEQERLEKIAEGPMRLPFSNT